MDERIPAAIRELMERKSLTSLNRISVATGLHTSTISGLLIYGKGSTTKTVEAVAEALGTTGDRLLEMIERPAGEIYTGPESSRTLTERQRRALDELIRSIAGTEVVGNAEHPAPIVDLDSHRPPATDERLPMAGREPHKGIEPGQDIDY
ncbi:hypothetical protein AB0E44_09165 [Micrococcus terreus]|uniref:hypothetical protein n=1 Tax=Micrococcus terreus TaxID=574650 RepID=UPI0033D0BFBA